MMRATMVSPMPFPGNSERPCKRWKGVKKPTGAKLLEARAVVTHEVDGYPVLNSRTELDLRGEGCADE